MTLAKRFRWKKCQEKDKGEMTAGRQSRFPWKLELEIWARLTVAELWCCSPAVEGSGEEAGGSWRKR